MTAEIWQKKTEKGEIYYEDRRINQNITFGGNAGSNNREEKGDNPELGRT